MRYCLISGKHCLIGKGIQFNLVPFFDLECGSKVSSIGDGRNTGTYRTDNLDPCLQYVGSIVCPSISGNTKTEEVYAFKYPNTPENNLKEGESIYILYQSTGCEILRTSYTSTGNSYVRFYKPKFKLYNE